MPLAAGQRRTALVVHTGAGGGRAGRVLPAVRARLLADGHDLTVEVTRSMEHADELVALALAQDRLVAALGGDGLVGRVAGAVARGDGVLAVLPGGRGNDLARSLGLPASAARAAALLPRCEERRLDLGEVGGRLFAGIASVGFDSEVQERALRTTVPLGRAVYALCALAALARWRPARFAVVVDGRPEEVVGYAVAVANSGTYGGGMRLAPHARLDDGRLDVVTMAEVPRATFVRGLGRVFRGTHLGLPGVATRSASTVELSADRPFRVFADGEPLAALPCTVSVRPGAVRVLLPPPRG